MKRYIFIIGVIAGACTVSAQDLRTEITVDRTVQPNIREATKPNGINPVILQPNIKLKPLGVAEFDGTGALTQDLSMLPPVAWADSIDHAAYRGYASVGYLPLYNLGINAGYRLVDTPRYGLGLWTQYNGNSYNGDLPYFEDALFTNHTVTVGGNGSAFFGTNSLLTAEGNITFKSVRTPYFLNDNGNEFRHSYTQSAKDMNLNAKWRSKVDRVVYSIKGGLGYFDLGNNIKEELSPQANSVSQTLVDLGGSLGVADAGTMLPWINIDAGIKVLHSTNMPQPNGDYNVSYVVKNQLLGSIKPVLRFENEELQGYIGANLTAAKCYDTKLRIAPEALIEFRPGKAFSLYAKASGGQHFNMMSDIFDLNPYVLPTEAYAPSNLAVVLEGGMNVGPYDGMSLGLHGGFAKADDYLSPLITIYKNGHLESTFERIDLNSWYLGADVAYSYKRWFVLSAAVKYGGANHDTNSWYAWADGAKVVANVGLKVTPNDVLEINVGYDMRYDRKCRSLIYPYANGIVTTVYTGIPNLGTVNTVNVGGSYRITRQLTAFLEADNVLNNRYKLISGMPSAGIHGLLGVLYKF